MQSTISDYVYNGNSLSQHDLRVPSITGLERAYNEFMNLAFHARVAYTFGDGTLGVKLFESIDSLLISNLRQEQLQMFLNSEPIRVEAQLQGTDFVASFYMEQLVPEAPISTLQELERYIEQEHPVYTVTIETTD